MAPASPAFRLGELNNVFGQRKVGDRVVAWVRHEHEGSLPTSAAGPAVDRVVTGRSAQRIVPGRAVNGVSDGDDNLRRGGA